MKTIPKTALALSFLALIPCGYIGSSLAAETSRVSVASNGIQGNSASRGDYKQALSADGRFVVFESNASNLVVGDNNNTGDVFVHDRQTHKTIRVSVDSNGYEGNNLSESPSISADGRFIAFQSYADNLVNGDFNSYRDVFVHDRQTRQTTRVSVSLFGGDSNWYSGDPSISADGRFVAFASKAANLTGFDANGVSDIFVHDRQTRQTTRVSETSIGGEVYNDSFDSFISADGRFVAFQSYADDLVAGDKNRMPDIFVHDRQTHQTTLVSLSSDGKQGDFSSLIPSISANGRYVAFRSDASTLVDGDNNSSSDIFVHDRQTHKTIRVSVDSAGVEGNSDSFSSNLSADGRFVAFESDANNLVPGDVNGTVDVFIHDLQNGQTKMASINENKVQGNSSSYSVRLNADGRYLSFISKANNLVRGDTNSANDVFVHDRFLDKTKSADMQITVTQKPATLARNTQGSFIYSLTNNGPTAIGGISLTHLTSQGAVVNFTPSQGRCKRYATIALCQLGTLAAGQSMTVGMTVKALARPNLGQQISVSAVGVDPKPGNNAIKVVTPVN